VHRLVSYCTNDTCSRAFHIEANSHCADAYVGRGTVYQIIGKATGKGARARDSRRIYAQYLILSVVPSIWI
jgi:hypothetical protein